MFCGGVLVLYGDILQPREYLCLGNRVFRIANHRLVLHRFFSNNASNELHYRRVLQEQKGMPRQTLQRKSVHLRRLYVRSIVLEKHGVIIFHDVT